MPSDVVDSSPLKTYPSCGHARRWEYGMFLADNGGRWHCQAPSTAATHGEWSRNCGRFAVRISKRSIPRL